MFRKNDQQKVLVFAIILLYVVVALLTHINSSGVYDAGDGINHHLIARYAWKHPLLFLDHWGKPFYTLVSSSFAQLGYTGSVVFNILCGAGTLACVAGMAKKLNYPNRAAAVFLAAFAPLFFGVSISGLTEPLFALVLFASQLLALRKRYVWAALLVSFLPFVRSEGFLLLPLFGLVLLLRKQWFATLWLSAGTLLYSLIGGFAMGDFLWVIHNNPYRGAEDIYGSGSLFHFVTNNEFILGTAGVVLLLIGCLFFVRRVIKKTGPKTFLPEELLLIYGCFFTYFIAHSFFWRFGLFGSLGLIRVLAAVAPAAALIAVSGVSELGTLWPTAKRLPQLVLAGACLITGLQTFRQTGFSFPINNDCQPAVDAADWLNAQPDNNNLIYAHHPYLQFRLKRDPFDENSIRNYWQLTPDAAQLRPGTYLIWDSHFGPGCDWPVAKMEQIPALKLVASFRGAYEEKRINNGTEWPEVRVYQVSK